MDNNKNCQNNNNSTIWLVVGVLALIIINGFVLDTFSYLCRDFYKIFAKMYKL
jgi:hypothetical protein